MSVNLHPLVLRITGEHPVDFAPEPAPYAWLLGSGAIPIATHGHCWARCDYSWLWWEEGHEQEAWREDCGAIAGRMEDGTRRCPLHARPWDDEQEHTTGR